MAGNDDDSEDDAAFRLSLFGAAGTNSNLGVRALMASAVTGIRRHAPSADLTVFDDDFGFGLTSFRGKNGEVPYRRCGARLSRRYYRSESYWNMRLAMRTVPSANPGMSLLMRSHAVLDISGGDSFTDMYGTHRFRAIVAPKRLALDAGRDLVLLPQAYGPFRNPNNRSRATAVLRRATSVWARDAVSHAAVADLLGTEFDPGRHRLGVDIAFGLDPVVPDETLREPVLAFVARLGGRPLVGINISGLLYNDLDSAQRYGLNFDYRHLCSRLVTRLLSETEACLMFVNHVLAPPGSVEADRVACSKLLATLPASEYHRVLMVSDPPGPGEAKWCIAHCDWFIGTRMHATIAALSSGVPAAAIAYSHKAAGVFATCGSDADVAEPGSDIDTAMSILWNAFESRDERRAALARKLPEVTAQAAVQMKTIVNECRTGPGVR